MLERQRREHFNPGPDPFSDTLGQTATATAPEARVEVIHGVYAHSFPLVGMTVAQARAELEDRLNIDPAAMAVVDGLEAPPDFVLSENQVLTFVKPAGEKG